MRLRKEQEPRPQGMYVTGRNVDLVVSHVATFMEQQDIQSIDKRAAVSVLKIDIRALAA